MDVQKKIEELEKRLEELEREVAEMPRVVLLPIVSEPAEPLPQPPWRPTVS